jgi:hypothetical protein
MNAITCYSDQPCERHSYIYTYAHMYVHTHSFHTAGLSKNGALFYAYVRTWLACVLHFPVHVTQDGSHNMWILIQGCRICAEKFSPLKNATYYFILDEAEMCTYAGMHMCGFKILQQSPSYNCTNLKPWLFTAFVLTKLTKMLFALISKYFMHTVKSPNNGHFRTVSFVLCKEGVLFGRLKMYQN